LNELQKNEKEKKKKKGKKENMGNPISTLQIVGSGCSHHLQHSRVDDI
jgi:hypothetical protein